MQRQKALIQKLSVFGLNAKQQNRKSLQQKIIEMYELLELKTTQNLLLRKENDDIKIQISTINDLFKNTDLNIESKSRKERISQMNDVTPLRNNSFQKKYIQFHQQQQNLQYENSSRNQYMRPKQEQLHKQNKYPIVYSSGTETQNTQFHQPNQQCPVKPDPNNRFCSTSESKAQSEDQNSQKVLINVSNKQGNNFDCKIQFLVRQNQTILKRMDQIETNFGNRTHEQNTNRRSKRNTQDDRETNFSGNTSSNRNIQTKDDRRSRTGLTPQSPNQCFTDDLRSYRPDRG